MFVLPFYNKRMYMYILPHLGLLSPQIFTHITTPTMYFKSHLRGRAGSSWALPHISG